MTHDYKRNGTTDLFAALNVGTGEVLTDCRKRHTGTDVLGFFRLIDLHVARELEVHAVLDNLSAHKAPEVTKWLADPSGPAGTCTSSPPAPAGSTSSSAGSRS
jgi:transposase